MTAMAPQEKSSHRRDFQKSAEALMDHIKHAVDKVELSQRLNISTSDKSCAPSDGSNSKSRPIGRRLSDSTIQASQPAEDKHETDFREGSLLNYNVLNTKRKAVATRNSFDSPRYKLDNSLLHTLASSKTWPGTELMAEPADLICFLAGCSPGNFDCKKQHAGYKQLSFEIDQVDGAQDSVVKATKSSMSRSSTLSSDQAPYAKQWMDTTKSPPPLSFTYGSGVATNFSLPGPRTMIAASNSPTSQASTKAQMEAAVDKGHRSIEKTSVKTLGNEGQHPVDNDNEAVSTRQLHVLSSIDPKIDYSSPSSLISKVSRTSAIRHGLLKSSVSESPIDLGLPVPPVLSTEVALPESMTNLSILKDQGSNSILRNKIQHTTQRRNPISPDNSEVPLLREQEMPLITVQMVESIHNSPPSTRSSSSSKVSNGAHLELVPTIKEAVQGAVDATVRTMVGEAIRSHAIDKSKASEAYRCAVAESLGEAAKEADDYLRHPSLWPDEGELHAHHGFKLEPCRRVTCLDKSSIQHCNTISCTPDLSPTHLKAALTWRGNDCMICPRPSDSSLAEAKAQATMESSMALDVTTKLPLHAEISSHNQRDHVDNEDFVVEQPSGQCFPLTRDTHTHSYRSLSLDSSNSDHTIVSIPMQESAHRDDPTKSLLSNQVIDNTDLDSLSYLSVKDPAKKRSTLKWLRDLLKNNEQHETRLTAIPPRARRSQDSPAPQAELQIVSAGENPINLRDDSVYDRSCPIANVGIGNQQKNVSIPEGLSKTILEIEELLKDSFRTATVGRISNDGQCNASHHPVVETHRLSKCESIQDSVQSCSVSASNSCEQNTADFQVNKMNPVPEKCFNLATTPQSFHAHLTKNSLANTFLHDEKPLELQDLKSSSYSRLSLPNRTTSTSIQSQNPHRVVARLSATPRNCLQAHVPLPRIIPRDKTTLCQKGHSEEDHEALDRKLLANSIPSKVEVLQHVMRFRQPPIQARGSSMRLKRDAENISDPKSIDNANPDSLFTGVVYENERVRNDKSRNYTESLTPRTTNPRARQDQLRQMSIAYSHSLDGTQWTHSDELDFNQGYGQREQARSPASKPDKDSQQHKHELENQIELRDVPNPNLPVNTGSSRTRTPLFNLKNKRHVSVADHRGFSLARSHKRQTIARDWSPGRKRFCAAVACISTALVGILVGIYAGETPAIQYWIVDFHHYTVLGNVFFFIGLSIPTFIFWPLPLLHGRKPYVLGAMSLAMPLLFPQALAVGELRSPYTHVWRVALILPRALMGFCLGFANMNFKGILTDLFGASLQSTNPHQEHVDEFDVRRHGGGMGVWLGLWTWSAMGSIGVGFLIGAAIINSLNPAWGFYVSITIIAFVLLLNILTPEVRRSAFRRSVAEVKNGEDVSRRLARGEVKMHMVQTGPKWWGEEFHYGLKLSVKMLRQPGFMVMAAYVAWMYGQIVLIVLLLGSLCSNSYRFKSHQVGFSVASVPLGALLAVPFQKASLFSRGRSHAPVSDDDTSTRKVKWSSHLVRRAIFVLALPFAGLGYTLSSGGAQIPFIIPILFAALIGFLSNLAMAECHGIIMETYDTSDLQPGMTGRSRGTARNKSANKRTNYSSFPRVSAAFGITQGLGYLFAAAASAVGGTLTRNLGQQAATGVMAFILLVLSVLLLGVLIRFKDVQIIPNCKKDEMNHYHQTKNAIARVDSNGEEIEPWRPIIIGNPHHSTRRMCILELGDMSRFSEIRRKNRLIDEQSLEARHPNQQMMMDVRQKFKEKEEEMLHHVKTSLSRHSSRKSLFSNDSRGRNAPEQGDLGGFVEVELGESSSRGTRKGNTLAKGKGKEREMHSAKGSVQRRATGIQE